MKLLKYTNKIQSKLLWVIDKLKWGVLFKISFKYKQKTKQPISIGVTTFMDRYENCLVPLIRKLNFLFPDNELIIIANGHVLKKEQDVYLKNITSFCSSYTNVKLYKHQQPKGLSSMWNQIIKNSSNDKVLLLNDDVDVKINFARFTEKILTQSHEIMTINGSWSHFVISKSLFDKIGDFDNGLIEIGGEDDDYAARLAMNNIPLYNFNTAAIASKLKVKYKRLVVNSYGKNMHEEKHGYSSYNDRYLAEKWQMSNEPFDGATEVPNRLMRYWKLRTNDPINKGV